MKTNTNIDKHKIQPCPECGAVDYKEDNYIEDKYLVEYLHECECGLIRDHWSYGQSIIRNFEPRETRETLYK